MAKRNPKRVQKPPIQVAGVTGRIRDAWLAISTTASYRRHMLLGVLALRYDAELTTEEIERIEDAIRRSGDALQASEESGGELDGTGSLTRLLRAIGPDTIQRLTG